MFYSTAAKLTLGTFNQEEALVGAFSMITNLRMDLRFKLYSISSTFLHILMTV